MIFNWPVKRFQETIDQPLLEADEGRSFFQNNIVRLLLLCIGLAIGALFGTLPFFLHPSEVLTVLHYNVYFGVDLLGSWWQAYILPGVALCFVGINIWLAFYFYARQQERIAAYLFLLGTLMLLAGVAIGCFAIVYINY